MMLEATLIRERRAYALVGLSRDSWRHPPQRVRHDQATSQRVVELAHERRRFGYRRIADLLRAAGTKINDKRVYRLYKLADLSVRKRRGKQRLKLERVPLLECQSLNEVWSMDFVSDSLANGRRIKCRTVTDDFSHECVGIAVDHGIGGEYVVRVLDQVARFRGYAQAARTDQGPEFTSRAFMAWAQAKGVRHILNQPGKPTQNTYIESFNGKFRDECLNEHWFQSLKQARAEIARRRTRPQRGAAARRLRSAATGKVRSPASSSSRRRSSPSGNLLLQTSGFLTASGTGNGGRSAEAKPGSGVGAMEKAGAEPVGRVTSAFALPTTSLGIR